MMNKQDFGDWAQTAAYMGAWIEGHPTEAEDALRATHLKLGGHAGFYRVAADAAWHLESEVQRCKDRWGEEFDWQDLAEKVIRWVLLTMASEKVLPTDDDARMDSVVREFLREARE